LAKRAKGLKTTFHKIIYHRPVVNQIFIVAIVTAMHALQPKHTKLKADEIKKLLEKYNISLSQLPKIHTSDPGLPAGCNVGDVIKIERKEGDKLETYHRAVVL